MAASIRRLGSVRWFRKFDRHVVVVRRWARFPVSNDVLSWKRSFWLLAGGCLSVAALYGTRKRALTEVKTSKGKGVVVGGGGPSVSDVTKPRLTQRERRFVKFASVEYDGQVYMTPQDFIESVTESEPRPRLKRHQLSGKELDAIQKMTPPVAKGSPAFFRKLGEQGIISYTEYLFMLSILTKPHSGFHIAFNMFDTDGNRRVDRQEFLVLAHLVAQYSWKESGWQYLTTFSKEVKNELDKVVNTTLMVHFFGHKGQGMLGYDDFCRFMENLQAEVLQIEFNEFSKGLPVISELDFAKILLRYTLLQSEDYDAYLTRLSQRIQHKQGITFEEFKAFCQFLNNLEDFGIAMRMYTLADRSISPVEEFNRAVKICTGQSLSHHLVDTVFQIFDEDGDGQLSYKEFIAIMRDRLHRGIKPRVVKNEGWEAFKSCIKQEMRSPV